MSRVRMRTCRSPAALLVIAWLFAALWLAGGVAYADDTTSHDSTPGTSQSGDPSATSADKPTADKPTASADKPTASEEKTDTPTRVGKPRGARKHGTAKQAIETTPDTKPDAKRGPDSDTKAGIKPKTKAAPEPDTKPLTTTAKKSGTTATATQANGAAAAAALKLASPAVLPSTTAKAPNPIAHAVQFVRQMTGLANDIGLLAVTVVNNLAAAAAATIGPKPFFGVPYHVASAIAGTAATAGKLLTGTPLNADSTVKGPFKVTYGVGDLLNYFNADKPPAGANDPSIKLTAQHPLPIILVAGTAANAPFNWSVGAPVLANAGYKVFTFNYGNVTNNPNWPVRGTGDIRESAQELADEVDRVLAETGAPKVILIGHSQGGGMTPEYYLNNLDGAAKVSQFIGIAPGNHGADLSGLAYIQNIPVIGRPIFNLVNLLGPAWLQQAIGSPLIDEIYGNGDTRPGVLYTTITTKDDWIVTPYTNQALDGPNVTNIILQDRYPNFNAGHLGIVFAAPTWDAVLGALAANPAANRAPQDQTIAA
ncbi:alpha/beta fold hydrolase [Mycolicibacterium fluoranthenivorans]|uniref:Alpha/beta hydrolase family protein n=1 Tax=Mycolicibacterium fluoranthenivorans TaxID=258505 RepID=A0A1G4VL07_9MYCO|nr:alpha/beta fold hydrolase [Mycolicibacterium fluoranthenivorans]SCX08344.1 Alpha/beta hydrolase family protein [Mycolicibacterium fluoranthenivorans]